MGGGGFLVLPPCRAGCVQERAELLPGPALCELVFLARILWARRGERERRVMRAGTVGAVGAAETNSAGTLSQ
jgi:hypothetical protein